eukprot:7749084-Ditylum_brightwellii.AAC.1
MELGLDDGIKVGIKVGIKDSLELGLDDGSKLEFIVNINLDIKDGIKLGHRSLSGRLSRRLNINWRMRSNAIQLQKAVNATADGLCLCV